jgi:hypothetical protein
MALERVARRSRGRVPEPDRLVGRCRRHQFAVRRECHGADPVRMALERVARGRVPEPDRPVGRCRRHQFAVRRECRGPDRVRMALERVPRRSRLGFLRCWASGILLREQAAKDEAAFRLLFSRWSGLAFMLVIFLFFVGRCRRYQVAVRRAACSILHWLGSHRLVVGRLEKRCLLVSFFDKEMLIRFEATMGDCIVTYGRDGEL